jgi:sigma-E factor negative regulatory protein RseA
MNLEELESQVSAMLDGELPAPECELLSRRLARDPALRARWSRYAQIGAAMRSEPVAGASAGFAARVSEAIAKPTVAQRTQTAWKAVLGSTMVAGIAGIAVLVLRADIGASTPGAEAQPAVVASQNVVQPAAAPQMANTAASARTEIIGSRPARFGTEPASYVVPPVPGKGSVVALPAQLANYVLAHSEYSSPLTRSGLLSSVVSNEEFAAEVAAQQQQAEAAEGHAGP